MEDKQFIMCPQCDNPLSPRALSCPQCGQPMQAYHGFEWKSPQSIGRWPLVHIAFGRDKTTGRFMVAKGVIAIGQFGVGLITLAQFGIGMLFGFGQFLVGTTAVAQVALTYVFGIGQFATGQTVIGQLAFGQYVLAQLGVGEHVWSVKSKDPAAIEHFQNLWAAVLNFLGWG